MKRTLMENGIAKLCVFFGRRKANDILLSHLITFQNDKVCVSRRFTVTHACNLCVLQNGSLVSLLIL